MAKDFKHIDNIYQQAFVDFKPDISANDWNKISKKSNADRFFKFKLNHFNIYYASLIVGAFLASLSVFVDYFFLQDDKQATPNENVMDYQQQDLNLDDKEIKESTLEILDSIVIVSEKKENLPKKQKVKKVPERYNAINIDKQIIADSISRSDTIVEQTRPIDSIKTRKVNTEPIVTPNNSQIEDSIELKQFDVRYETITIHDTVFTHKKKKEKKNSKFGLFKSK